MEERGHAILDRVTKKACYEEVKFERTLTRGRGCWISGGAIFQVERRAITKVPGWEKLGHVLDAKETTVSGAE